MLPFAGITANSLNKNGYEQRVLKDYCIYLYPNFYLMFFTKWEELFNSFKISI